jgi:hypothetical protein
MKIFLCASTIGNARFEAFIERKQAGFECLALTDLVVDACYPAGAAGFILGDLALPGDPMDAAVGMREPKFNVIRTPFTRNFDR